jgi:predicted RNA-binding Zn-ribbon protein involved in translation (DUF1610 family)
MSELFRAHDLIEPGLWCLARWEDKYSAVICCPSCGDVLAASAGEIEGEAASFYCEMCGWEDRVLLVGWSAALAFCTRPRRERGLTDR